MVLPEAELPKLNCLSVSMITKLLSVPYKGNWTSMVTFILLVSITKFGVGPLGLESADNW